MITQKIILIHLLLFVSISTYAQQEQYQKRDWSKVKQVVERELPEEWKNLVPGAQFQDRFLPMPNGKLSDQVWGGKNVLPRYIDNGIEDPKLSLWGGNILTGDDGNYHFFVCGWPESHHRGHRYWGRSKIYHAICDNPFGPFEIKDTLGYGHNPDTYRLKDGRYVTYSFSLISGTRTYGMYVAPTVYGPWTYQPFEYEGRDRNIRVITNFTFSQREDGSFIGVAKDGRMWISKDGLSPYKLIDQKNAYPVVEAYLEDPAIWRDHVQYHMVVNDAHGRVAYYSRSINGIDWVWEEGIAYQPGMSKHKNGHVENWHKYERLKIMQDEFGRAVQANIAVMDTTKDGDKGSDNHSSKNISVPLNPGLLISWEGENKQYPKTVFNPIIRIKAEKGFNPSKDLDISSLRFGDAKEVNFGKGSKVITSKKDGKDLILTFDATGHHISEKEFAPKLLGKDKKGRMVFGYTRLPWVEYTLPILSARAPVPVPGTNLLSIKVENFGLISSQQATLFVKKDDEILGSTQVPSIKPYHDATLNLEVKLEKGKHELIIEIKERKSNESSFRTMMEVL